MARQICSAMAFAHQNGIYHGHLSANSILFDDSGAIQIADFSLKPELDRDTPEFLDKKRFFSADIDLRSAGLLFFHLLTGEAANFKAGHIKNTQHFKQLPEKLQEVIKGMLGLSYKPFNSFTEVQSALDAVTDALPTMFFNQGREQDALNRKKKIGWIIVGALVVAACIAAALRFL
jgi:eukaryotic-like serine/threonine-protein kinase